MSDATRPSATATATAVSAPLHAVHLSDVQRVLALFTQGIAGQYLHLRPIEAVDGDSGTRGQGATTDGNAIYLPASVANFADTRHNLGVYRIAVLHQLGFFENGTFAFSMQRARARLSGLPEESPDNADKTGLARFFSLWPSPRLMRRTFILLEDLRIDQAMRRRYPGARQDLERVLADALRRRPDAGTLAPPAALWERLLQFTLGAPRQQLVAQDPDEKSAALLAGALEAAACVARDGATVYDSAQAAVSCYAALLKIGQAAEGAPPPGEGEQAAAPESNEAAGHPDFFDEDDVIGNSQVDFRGELVPEHVDEGLYGDMEEAFVDSEGFADAPRKPKAQRDGAAPGRSGSELPEDKDKEGEAARSFLYDEWNYLNESYIKGWCRLFEHRLQGDDYHYIREVHRRHATLAAQVKRRFKFIKPESLRRVRHVNDGEELELEGIIEAVTDRRAGRAGDDRVYSRRDRALREVAAAFLLDMSASTEYPIPEKVDASAGDDQDAADYRRRSWAGKPRGADPESPKRRVIDVARESLALMCEALATLGDSHAIYGFSGQGRKNVDFFVAKEFEDKVSARTWAALAAMKAQLCTRMGPAIRHAVSKLSRQQTRMKVLIMVSDGYPQDFDYGPDKTSDEYGIQDTARALKEAEDQGVHTFCVTIDPTGHDYLRRMCPDQRYMVIDEVDDLPGELTKVYRALTA